MLHVIIITAIGALIVKYSKLAALIFFILSTIALVFDKYVENNYLKKIGEDAND
ncbi:hypothetical protein [Sulfurisphaera ohwakuensis]|uniref:hypothetical protein n=1 Tax=Sulfurisphaera ohwakuensis TaxID=69656 RepID=UPI0036F2AFEB